MTGCTACTGGFRGLLSSKLGRCPKCMRLAARGSLAGWALAAVAYVLSPGALAVALTALGAAAFTLVWAAHVLAFAFRYRDQTSRGTAGDPELDRRAFVTKLVQAGSLAFVGSLVGFRILHVESASAQEGEHICPHKARETRLLGKVNHEIRCEPEKCGEGDNGQSLNCHKVETKPDQVGDESTSREYCGCGPKPSEPLGCHTVVIKTKRKTETGNEVTTRIVCAGRCPDGQKCCCTRTQVARGDIEQFDVVCECRDPADCKETDC